jgi:adenine nucleotide transporter 17
MCTQVTYPYIMAKVRIQTRQKGAEEEENGALPAPAVNGSPRRPRDEGAVDILARVLRSEGFSGWYKVRLPAAASHPHCLMPRCL